MTTSFNAAKAYSDTYEEARARWSQVWDEQESKISKTKEEDIAEKEGFIMVDEKSLTVMDMTNTNAIEAQKTKVGAVVSTLATTISTGAFQFGLGAKALTHGAGAYFYATKAAEWGILGSTRVGQYFLANTVSSATGALVSTPLIGGISAGAVATGVTAVATGYLALKAGEFIYNHTVAKTPEQKINTDATHLVKKLIWG
jgi:hypothetical protein